MGYGTSTRCRVYGVGVTLQEADQTVHVQVSLLVSENGSRRPRGMTTGSFKVNVDLLRDYKKLTHKNIKRSPL